MSRPAHEVNQELRRQQYERRVRDRLLTYPNLRETCAYCGDDTLCEHRVIRAATSESEPGATPGENGWWVADPVCGPCHRGENRVTIKGHFCPTGMEGMYLRRAGSQQLGA